MKEGLEMIEVWLSMCGCAGGQEGFVSEVFTVLHMIVYLTFVCWSWLG